MNLLTFTQTLGTRSLYKGQTRLQPLKGSTNKKRCQIGSIPLPRKLIKQKLAHVYNYKQSAKPRVVKWK